MYAPMYQLLFVCICLKSFFRKYEAGDGEGKKGKFRLNDKMLLLVYCDLSAIVNLGKCESCIFPHVKLLPC